MFTDCAAVASNIPQTTTSVPNTTIASSTCTEESNTSDFMFEENISAQGILKVDTIWTPEVEGAFRTALSIIPKSGLKKNKICSRALGRNQYIEMYIEAMTGRTRKAKQISSHIQTIMRRSKDKELLNLIKFGAPNTPEVHMRFEQVFSAILSSKGDTKQPKKVKRRNSTKPNISVMTPSYEFESIIFSAPNQLLTLLPSIILTSELVDRFPNVLINIRSVREMLIKTQGVQETAIVPVPFLYKHTKIHLPRMTAGKGIPEQVHCGKPLNIIVQDSEPLQLGLLTMVYCKGQKIHDDFILFTKECDFDDCKKFWTQRVATKFNNHLQSQKPLDWVDDVVSVTMEKYVVSVSNSGDGDVCIDQIQSIIINDFEYCHDPEMCLSDIRECIGYDFDINKNSDPIVSMETYTEYDAATQASDYVVASIEPAPFVSGASGFPNNYYSSANQISYGGNDQTYAVYPTGNTVGYTAPMHGVYAQPQAAYAENMYHRSKPSPSRSEIPGSFTPDTNSAHSGYWGGSNSPLYFQLPQEG